MVLISIQWLAPISAIVNMSRYSAMFIRPLFIGAISLSLIACLPSSITQLGAATRAELRAGFSPQTLQRQRQLHSMDYAQLFVRWEDGRELTYLLADRRSADNALRWIGSNGSVLMMRGATILSISGVRGAIEQTSIIKPGSMEDWIRSPPMRDPAAVRIARESVVRYQQAGPASGVTPPAFTIRSSIIERTPTFFSGLAFTGAVDRFTERAVVDETGETLLRFFWVEPNSGALLRIQGDLAPNIRQVTMEWTRVPTEGRPPMPRNHSSP